MTSHKQGTQDSHGLPEASAAIHHREPAYWTDKMTVVAAVIICVATMAGALAIFWATKAG